MKLDKKEANQANKVNKANTKVVSKEAIIVGYLSHMEILIGQDRADRAKYKILIDIDHK